MTLLDQLADTLRISWANANDLNVNQMLQWPDLKDSEKDQWRKMARHQVALIMGRISC